ncbi:hypothetical protein EJ04DRAFT_435054 [Polyplosphaeria fusca]|uniref:Uncharacterized protein n=1 Tax=Polyplosphaeria fusca TaxID=682080 RepID=A0A9P4QXB8_9PLEO|nr:hypothetical protein EJ04DRAFT_435054 [Polyplosphaeria fusca]
MQPGQLHPNARGTFASACQPSSPLKPLTTHPPPAGLVHQQQPWQHQQQIPQHQQHQQLPHQNQHLASPSPYSNPPFSQALSSPAHQHFAQNRQTASPSNAANHVPPYANPQAQHHLQQQHQQSPTVPSNSQPAMAAAAVSQPQTSQAMQAQTPTKPVPQSPVSPAAQARESERYTTLLDINNLLIKELMNLNGQGKAGPIGPTPQDSKPDGEKPQQATKEYMEALRRLQSNLAFLAQNAEKNHKPNQSIQPGPAIMTAPAAPAELVELYTKLQGLYPGWKGQTGPPKSSPGPQRMPSASQTPNSAGPQNTMQPPNSAGLPSNSFQHQSSSTPPQNPAS